MALINHQSNKLSNLIGVIANQVRLEGLHKPLRFVVSSFAMEQFLRQQIAHINGIFAHADFKFPNQFITTIAELFALTPSPLYSRNGLLLRLYQTLQDTAIQQLANDHLKDYFKTPETAIKEQRLFALASSLAESFEHYQWQRADWLAAWQKGHSINSLPKPLTRLQQALWKQLKQHSTADQAEQFEQLLRVLGRKSAKPILSGHADSIYVFALTPMQVNVLRLCQALAQSIDVHIYRFNPCQELWFEQLQSPYIENTLYWQNQTPINTQNESLFYQHHPLLMALGQQGAALEREYLQSYNIDYFSDKPPTCLLQLCQQQILHNTPADHIQHQLNNQSETFKHDSSISIHHANCAQDELYFLRQEMIHWLEQNPTTGLHEILVVAPEINDYAAWIPTIFADAPYKIAQTSDSQFNNCFDCLIQLLQSDFNLTDVENYLIAVCWPKPLQAYQSILSLLKQQGFRAGISTLSDLHLQQQRSLQVSLAKSWQQILQSTEELPMDWQDLTKYNQTLLDLTRFWQDCQGLLSLQQWIDHLDHWLGWLQFNSDIHTNNYDANKIRSLLKELKQLALDCDFNQPIRFKQMLRFWQHKRPKPAATVRFFDGNLTFANMQSLRQIPHRFIAILGLDNRFASAKAANLFDLCAYAPRAADHNQADDQRYQLLEYLISASGKLWLSYSDIDDSPSSPCSLLTHLQTTLNLNTIEHDSLGSYASSTLWQLAEPITSTNNRPLRLTKTAQTPLNLSINDLANQLAKPFNNYLHQSAIKRIGQLPPASLNTYQEGFSGLHKSYLLPNLIRQILPSQEPEKQLPKTIAELTQHWQCQYLDANQLKQNMLGYYQELEPILTQFKQQLAITQLFQTINEAKPQPLFRHFTEHAGQPIQLYGQADIERQCHNQQAFVHVSYRLSLQDILQAWLLHLISGRQAHLLRVKQDHPSKYHSITLPKLTKQQRQRQLQHILTYHQQLAYQATLLIPSIIESYLLDQSWQRAFQLYHTKPSTSPMPAELGLANRPNQTLDGSNPATIEAYQDYIDKLFSVHIKRLAIR